MRFPGIPRSFVMDRIRAVNAFVLSGSPMSPAW